MRAEERKRGVGAGRLNGQKRVEENRLEERRLDHRGGEDGERGG